VCQFGVPRAVKGEADVYRRACRAGRALGSFVSILFGKCESSDKNPQILTRTPVAKAYVLIAFDLGSGLLVEDCAQPSMSSILQPTA
jgi:hypothetical protein